MRTFLVQRRLRECKARMKCRCAFELRMDLVILTARFFRIQPLVGPRQRADDIAFRAPCVRQRSRQCHASRTYPKFSPGERCNTPYGCGNYGFHLVASQSGQSAGTHHKHSIGIKDMIPNAQINDIQDALFCKWTCSTHPLVARMQIDALSDASCEARQ